MIRPLKIEELHLVGDLGNSFYKEAEMPSRFIPKVFEQSFGALIEFGAAEIYGLFAGKNLVGVVGGMAFPDLYDGEPVVIETFWFVKEEFRGSGMLLFDTFEKWAGDQGAKRVIVSHQVNLMPEKLKTIYKRKGYKMMETNFVKEVR